MSNQKYQETMDWYQEHAVDYAEKSTRESVIDTQQLEEFSNLLKPGVKILDAGCGAGRDTNLFQKKGFMPTGMDLSTKLIVEARKRYPNCDFKEGDLLSLPYESESFDGVWAHASLVHFETLEQMRKAIRELFRVAKKDAVLHLLVRAHDAKSEEVRSDAISQSNRYYRNFTEKEIRDLVSSEGFKSFKVFRYKESDLDPKKRPDDAIEWILVLARK